MIRKLQWKFVAMCMVMVTAILAVVFSSLYFSARHSIEQNSRAVLERVITEADADRPALPFRPGTEFTPGGGDVQLPYFTAQLWGANVYVTSGTYTDLEDTSALTSILAACLENPEETGVLKEYGMRYLRRERSLYTQLAFVDTSMEQATLRSLMQWYLLIAAASLALLLGVSVLLSRWATRPVERAWQQQRQFLSDASHELKTPLTVILSHAELMRSQPMDERSARWTDNIRAEAGRMKTLVEEMLTLARGDNAAPAAAEDVSLSDVAADCALSFEPVAYEAGKQLHYSIRKDVTVRGDAESLRRAVNILLDNAVKYGADGGRVTLTLEKNDRSAVVQVENDHGGDPIPPEVLSHLFERFYRADESRSGQTGFGLGLAIAAAAAEQHKGTIRAESDAVSTRFFLTLPLKK